MQITMVGAGYVGLVTGTCFAESGNEVTCYDVDGKRIELLQQGGMPIYEPGLAELVVRNVREGRLRFTSSLAEALGRSPVLFLAVGTPQGPTGAADLSAMWAVGQSIRQNATKSKLVVIKSTVPIGTNRELALRLNSGARIQHEVASNPEFLKEGHAIEDFMKPDRVVVGTDSSEASDVLKSLYAPFLRTGHPFLVMSPESAELTKYVANAMLATKISFINEMANLCEAMGGDINDVRNGIGFDARIGFHFLHPGPGYGGSCFPKDTRALIACAHTVGSSYRILQAVDEVNSEQAGVLFKKVVELIGPELNGKTVGVWGLAFKPGTDDVREAPSQSLLRSLLRAGVHVRVHDPEAMPNIKHLFGDTLTYCDRPIPVAQGCDALVIVTEWPEFRNPDFKMVLHLLARPVIVDGRNLYDPAEMRRLGFTYASIGRKTVRNIEAGRQELRAA